jgi:hypothetical protein
MDSDPTPGPGSSATNDLLAEIDEILQRRSRSQRQLAEDSAERDTHRAEFLEDFAAVCEREVRPTMEAALGHLRQNGGGGLIQERGGSIGVTPRVTLWMSLEGEIYGSPRQDRHPYLQLDADAVKGQVEVSEGDMWQGAGTHTSGRARSWQLSEITKETVSQTIVAILRRAAT